MTSLDSYECMIHQCKEFVELMSVDSDLKVAEEDEEGIVGGRFQTPSDGDDSTMLSAPGGSKKGPRRKGPNETPSKKVKKRSSSLSKGRVKKDKRPSMDVDSHEECDDLTGNTVRFGF